VIFILFLYSDKENNIIRPRQVYLGSDLRQFVPIDQREGSKNVDITSGSSSEARRRYTASNMP
jgi:hypothetical protein